MSNATEIEKKSLEAHVELCAERYASLDTRLDNMNDKISKVDRLICEVHSAVNNLANKNTDRIIGWGVAIIGVLVGAVGWLLAHYVLK